MKCIGSYWEEWEKKGNGDKVEKNRDDQIDIVTWIHTKQMVSKKRDQH